MKRLLSAVLTMVLLVGSMGAAFAGTDIGWNPDTKKNDLFNTAIFDVESPYQPMQKPAWFYKNTKDRYIAIGEDAVTKGFLEADQWAQLHEMIEFFDAKLLVSLNYELENSGDRYSAEFAQDLYEKEVKQFGYLKNGLVDAEGNPIYLCYNSVHLKDALDLSIYNILEKDDPVLDLRALTLKSEAVRLMVKAMGFEQEALSKHYEHPFVGAPENALAYIGLAYKKGWFGQVSPNTTWNENDLTSITYGEMYERSKGVDLVAEKWGDNPAQYAIDLPRRLGTFEDVFKGKTLLGQGEPLRNGDLVSMVATMLDQTSSRYQYEPLKNLVKKNLLSQEALDFMNYQEYFVTYEDNDPIAQQIPYQYGKAFVNVGGVIHYDGDGYLRKDPRAVSQVYVNGEYVGSAAMKSIAVAVLRDFGISRSKAEAIINKEIKGDSRTEKTIVDLEDDLQIKVGCNSGYFSEEKGRRNAPFIYMTLLRDTKKVAKAEPVQTPKEAEKQVEKEVSYAGLNYAESMGQAPMLTRYFRIKGSDSLDTTQIEGKLHLNAFDKVKGHGLGASPKAFAAYSDGQFIKNTTDATYDVDFKVTNSKNDEGRGGILFAVTDLPFSDKGLQAMGISLNPSKKQIIVEKFEGGSSYPIRTFDLPSSSDPSEGVSLIASIWGSSEVVLMNLDVDGKRLMSSMYLGKPEDIPAQSYFGFQTNNADVEFSSYKCYGTMTMPRQ